MVAEKIHLIKVIFIIGESRISRGGGTAPTPKVGCQPIILPIISQKLHEIGDKIEPSGSARPQLHPPPQPIRQRKSTN